MKMKVLVTLLLALVWWFINTYAPLPITAQIEAGAVASDLTAEGYRQSQFILAQNFPAREVGAILIIFLLLLIWMPELKTLGQRIGNKAGMTGALAALLLFAACRPVNVVTKEPNEVIFSVPVVASAENQAQISADEFANPEQVYSTEIEVDRTYVCTSYLGPVCVGGYYRPSRRLYVVNISPVNVQWTAPENAPPVESAESSGFSVPIILSATLVDDDTVIPGTEELNADGTVKEGTGIVCKGAATYLNIFGRKVEVAADQVEVEAKPLAEVITETVYPQVAGQLSSSFAVISINSAVAKKTQFIDEMTLYVQRLFAGQGVCITSIETTSGLLYDDPIYQDQINNAAARALDEEAAQANATTSYINANARAVETQIAVNGVATQSFVQNQQLLAQAEIQATAAKLQSDSRAEAIRSESEAIDDDIIAYEYAQNYGGGCVSNCFGDTSGVLPIYNINPQGTPPAP